MSALRGPASRLRAARLLVTIGIRDDRGGWPDAVRAVLDAGADLLRVRDERAPREDLPAAIDAAREIARARRRGVVVEWDPAATGPARAEFVHFREAPPVPGEIAGVPRGALVGVTASTPRSVRLGLADPRLAWLLVRPGRGDAVREAARLASPRDPLARPWFAEAAGADGLDAVLAAGAARIALSIAPDQDARAATERVAVRLAALWREDPGLSRVQLAAAGA